MNEHVRAKCAKARALTGFIRRETRELADPLVARSLYTSLVVPHLEYASIVWAPHYTTFITLVEKVQERALRFFASLLPSPPSPLSYYELCLLFKLRPLHERRAVALGLFAFDLMSGRIDSSQLLSRLNFNCPTRVSRHHTLFVPFRFSANYAFYGPINEIMTTLNRFANIFDFGMERNMLRRRIQNALSND